MFIRVQVRAATAGIVLGKESGEMKEQVRVECEGRVLFEDQAFPSDDTSVFSDGSTPIGRLEGTLTWLRPQVNMHMYNGKCQNLAVQGLDLQFSKLQPRNTSYYLFIFILYLQEICQSPALFPGDINSAHPKQGLLGDCWFLCACSFLVKNKHLLDKVAQEAFRLRFQKWASLMISYTSPDDPLKVMPPDQPQWGDSRYRGSFQFCFWQQGHWTDVIIDDRLPCIKASLCFSQCQSPTVFWVALLEKAYAKLVTYGAFLHFDLLRSNIFSNLDSTAL